MVARGLCLQAMTLSIIALQQGLNLEIENDYISQGYLAYLRSDEFKSGPEE
jgi:hypothetical protein